MKFLNIAISLAAAACVVAGAAQAQSYPAKPIRWVVPYTPAGAFDGISRIVAEKMSTLLGQQVVVDNRPGADGAIGLDLVAKAAPDGYTLAIGGLPTHGINPSLVRKLPYDHVRDFAPVSMLGMAAVVLVVNPELPAKTVGEFVAYAKANPGKLSYGSSGAGMHLTMEMLRAATGLSMVAVPYKGSAPAIVDLIAGQIPAMIDSVPAELAYIRSGRVRALAVGSARRTRVLPEVPTFLESGIPVESTLWYALFAPAATPRTVIDRLNGALVRVMAMDDVARRLTEIGIEASSSTPAELAAFVKSETVKWAKVVKDSGIELN
jgi:tripartite-type tricarboxylate transporter receptor subunit TctC